jgi:hypothetical protein
MVADPLKSPANVIVGETPVIIGLVNVLFARVSVPLRVTNNAVFAIPWISVVSLACELTADDTTFAVFDSDELIFVSVFDSAVATAVFTKAVVAMTVEFSFAFAVGAAGDPVKVGLARVAYPANETFDVSLAVTLPYESTLTALIKLTVSAPVLLDTFTVARSILSALTTILLEDAV